MNKNTANRINWIKYILRIVAWCLVTLSLLTPLLLSLMPVQHWLACHVSAIIVQQTGIHADIGSLQIRFGGQIVLDDVVLYDDRDSVALQARRLAAKLDFMPLLEGKIHIASAQLNGAHITLCQDSATAPLNIQSVIHALSSKDSTSSNPLDLQIRTLAIRKSSVRYDRWDASQTPTRFNPLHLALDNISLTSSLHHLTQDSLSLTIRHMAFHDISGLTIREAELTLQADTQHVALRDFLLSSNHSNIRIPLLSLAYNGLPQRGQSLPEWLQTARGDALLEAKLIPSEFSMFQPALHAFEDGIELRGHFQLHEGRLHADTLLLNDTRDCIRLEASGEYLISTQPALTGRVTSLRTAATLKDFLHRNLFLTLPPAITHLGQTNTSADISWAEGHASLSLTSHTEAADLTLQATSPDQKTWQTQFQVSNLMLDRLLENSQLPTDITLHGQATGSLPAAHQWPLAQSDITIQRMLFRQSLYEDIRLQAQSQPTSVSLSLTLEHDNIDLASNLALTRLAKGFSITAVADVAHFRPHDCGLTKGLPHESFTGRLLAEAEIQDLDHIEGALSFDSLLLNHDSLGCHQVGNITLQSSYEDNQKRLTIASQPLSARMEGRFQWAQLGASLQSIVHSYLPSFVAAPRHESPDNEFSFQAHLQDTTLLPRLADIQLRLPQPCRFMGSIASGVNLISASAYIPLLHYDKEQLSDLRFQVQTTQDILHGTVQGRRKMKTSDVLIGAELFANDRQGSLRLFWDNEKAVANKGTLSIHGSPYPDEDGKQAFEAHIAASSVVINDTMWQIMPARIDYEQGRLHVENLGAHSGTRFLRVNGTASRAASDTLVAELNDINVSYILNMVNFHSVEFDGEASGRILATNVFDKPRADAHLRIRDFLFNEAPLGTLSVYGNYGDHDKSIFLDADIADAPVRHKTHIRGTITPGRGEGTGLNLHILTQRINLAFLHAYTKGFMSYVEGRASGWARVFGPFKTVDLEGDLEVEDTKMHINALNTLFTIPRDSVHLRSGIISLDGIRAYDALSTGETSDHRAILTGALRHRYLGRMTYDLHAQANRLLCFHQPSLGSESFCGTAIMDGDVHIWGGMGALHVDVEGTPREGSTLTYNATQPDKITDANFIRFRPFHADTTATHQEIAQEEAPSSDIFLNFNLHVTPQLQLKVLMDARSGDHISITGEGHMRASYFNKGNFQLYGTYHVEQGRYDLSIQDILHKDFRFRQGGTIVFGGNPNLAALNLKAAYTIPNVSLDDLSTSSLGLPNTRVDCIMNIGGQPRSPSIAFDFELPNANEEERQMVRSMLSTEEERNLQVIYLLGIGRFLNLDGSNGQSSQSQMAVNSIVSSTISSQFNRVLSSVIGNSNWNLGTNLRTGQMGWDNVDVEGILSGKLFNNRLLINGNFGYRERFYNSSNFVGDFDVQYLITPTGSVALKAYNKSNDRYFIQSSLNTQGIGIQLKKDFHFLRDLFFLGKKSQK